MGFSNLDFEAQRIENEVMSEGTPTGGMMRQRHSQSSTSGGGDVDVDVGVGVGVDFDSEDDACSSRSPSLSMAVAYKAKTWIQVLENLLWITSATFILYFGDMHSNFLFLLIWDDRIKRYCLFSQHLPFL